MADSDPHDDEQLSQGSEPSSPSYSSSEPGSNAHTEDNDAEMEEAPAGPQRGTAGETPGHVYYGSEDGSATIDARQRRMHALGPRQQRPLGAQRPSGAMRTRTHIHARPARADMHADILRNPVYGVSAGYQRVQNVLNDFKAGRASEETLNQAVQLAYAEQQTLQAQHAAAEARTAAATATRRQADQALSQTQRQLQDLQQQVTSLEAERDAARVDHSKVLQQLAEAQASTDALTSKSFISALAKPSVFYGIKQKDKCNITEWISTVEDYLYSSQVAGTDVRKVQFAESYLSADALRAWKVAKATLNCTVSDDASPYAGVTFDLFKKHLLDRWNPTCTEVDARFNMDALTQRNLSMSAFINRFDDICTYLPNMEEKDKIHKFLTKLDDTYAVALAADPQTKQRWESYSKLKDFAINYATTLASISHAARKRSRAGHLESQTEASGHLLRQHSRRDADEGWQQVKRKRHNGGSGNGHAGSSSRSDRPSTSGSIWRQYKNKDGVAFQRHQSLVNWCHGKGVCLCCYHKYEADNSKQQHRHNCAKAPATGLPPGYTIPSRDGKHQ